MPEPSLLPQLPGLAGASTSALEALSARLRPGRRALLERGQALLVERGLVELRDPDGTFLGLRSGPTFLRPGPDRIDPSHDGLQVTAVGRVRWALLDEGDGIDWLAETQVRLASERKANDAFESIYDDFFRAEDASIPLNTYEATGVRAVIVPVRASIVPPEHLQRLPVAPDLLVFTDYPSFGLGEVHTRYVEWARFALVREPGTGLAGVYCPELILNSCAGTVVGREVFGFPKRIGRVAMEPFAAWALPEASSEARSMVTWRRASQGIDPGPFGGLLGALLDLLLGADGLKIHLPQAQPVTLRLSDPRELGSLVGVRSEPFTGLRIGWTALVDMSLHHPGDELPEPVVDPVAEPATAFPQVAPTPLEARDWEAASINAAPLERVVEVVPGRRLRHPPEGVLSLESGEVLSFDQGGRRLRRVHHKAGWLNLAQARGLDLVPLATSRVRVHSRLELDEAVPERIRLRELEQELGVERFLAKLQWGRLGGLAGFDFVGLVQVDGALSAQVPEPFEPLPDRPAWLPFTLREGRPDLSLLWLPVRYEGQPGWLMRVGWAHTPAALLQARQRGWPVRLGQAAHTPQRAALVLRSELALVWRRDGAPADPLPSGEHRVWTSRRGEIREGVWRVEPSGATLKLELVPELSPVLGQGLSFRSFRGRMIAPPG